MTKRKESGFDSIAQTRESGKKTTRKHNLEVPEAKTLILSDIGYPFRMKGDPQTTGIELDNEDLFADYSKEQWTGTVVRKGMYLFDRYIVSDIMIKFNSFNVNKLLTIFGHWDHRFQNAGPGMTMRIKTVWVANIDKFYPIYPY